MATFEVDIDLSDACTDDIIDALENKYDMGRFTSKEKDRLKGLIMEITGLKSPQSALHGSLLDQLKVELLIEARDKYTLEELQNRLK